MQDGVGLDEAQDYGEVPPEPYHHVAHLLRQGLGVGYGDAVLAAFEPHLQSVPAPPVGLFGTPISERPEHPPCLLAGGAVEVLEGRATVLLAGLQSVLQGVEVLV